jgi:hypothetical protein
MTLLTMPLKPLGCVSAQQLRMHAFGERHAKFAYRISVSIGVSGAHRNRLEAISIASHKCGRARNGAPHDGSCQTRPAHE